ncbi:MAG: anion permease [Sutterellaceae bacterium]|nr:anion permease [Sutterellaceae bacterium]MDD7441674.1 DASS family sodium-coupled anion symporter [Sutterellaceae bacterium]MDY2868272.1 DASS family sodium-coupled anion symporter [Mesosutterella sp.]
MDTKKLVKFVICFLPLLLLFTDPPAGMNPKAWGLFPFYVGTILGIMLHPMTEAAVLMIFLGLYAVIMKGQAVALSGFALNMTWLVVGAFVIAQAFRDTQLGKRIAYHLIGLFGKTSLGLGYAAAFSDFVIAPVTPSNAARTGGIIFPIFRSVAEALGSTPEHNPNAIGAYLSQLLYMVTMCTGITFLTGYAANTVAWAMTDQLLGLEVSWMQWTTCFIVPAGIVLLISPWIIHKIYKPTIGRIDNKKIAREGLDALGPMTGNEKILLCLFVLAIALWATSSYTKINSTAVVLGFIALSLLTGILKWKDIAVNSQIWSTLAWYGGILGMAGALNKFKFFNWMAQWLQTYVDFSSFSHVGLLITLVFAGTACRYLFVSCGAYMASVIPVQYTIGLAAGLPAWDMFVVFVTCGVMGAYVTHYANAAGPVLFGAGYVPLKKWWATGLFMTLLSYVIFALIGVPYWKLIGVFTSL